MADGPTRVWSRSYGPISLVWYCFCVSRVIRLVTLTAVVLGVFGFTSVAEGSHAESLSLNVSFDYSGNIAVTLPNGTPVGVTTGSPTVIPAGFYTISLTQPGCVDIPYFNLNGPGVSIADNLSGGEVTSSTDDADFLPNSTYTWDNDNNRAVVYTFVTSSQVLGTPPPPASAVLKLRLPGPAVGPGPSFEQRYRRFWARPVSRDARRYADRRGKALPCFQGPQRDEPQSGAIHDPGRRQEFDERAGAEEEQRTSDERDEWKIYGRPLVRARSDLRLVEVRRSARQLELLDPRRLKNSSPREWPEGARG